ncbi:MAG: FtsH protease activity modulator HflK [Planctomycetota bacterium]
MARIYNQQWSEDDQQIFRLPQIKFNLSWLKILIPVFVVLWLASGIYIVDPDEQGVVRRFGKVIYTTEPGPHYHWPVPIEQANKVKVKQVRRLEVGFRTINPGPPAIYRDMPKESLMLTGDEQIIDAQMIVQYQVDDPAKFLFNVKGLEGSQGALMDAAEVSLRHVVGQRPIDDVLITEKLQIEIDIRLFMQEIINRYKSGIKIGEVKLQTVRPPEQVEKAFSDVVSAKEDRERLVKEADGYKEDIIPKARGEAQSIIRNAEAYKAEREKTAEGDADRFLAVLTEYQKAKDVTRKRLYLETVIQIMPNIKKIIIDPEVSGNLLPFLPLEQGAQK